MSKPLLRAVDGGSELIFDNGEYVTTRGAAEYLSRLLGKRLTANAIRIKVHRKQIVPKKLGGPLGESFFKVSDLRECFVPQTRRHKNGS